MMISLPDAPPGQRWFKAVYPELEMEGVWHLGYVASGTTWPAISSRCGFRQIDVEIGRQETSLMTITRAENVCVICYVLRRR
jgi:hypothetical protein